MDGHSTDLNDMEVLPSVSPVILLQWDASLSSSQMCALQTPQKHHTVLYMLCLEAVTRFLRA